MAAHKVVNDVEIRAVDPLDVCGHVCIECLTGPGFFFVVFVFIRTMLNFLNFMKLTRFFANTFIHHPKKSIGAIALIITLAFLLNFISTSNRGSIGEGNYVKHSSGGWIELQNGQYVPGTLTDKKP